MKQKKNMNGDPKQWKLFTERLEDLERQKKDIEKVKKENQKTNNVKKKEMEDKEREIKRKYPYLGPVFMEMSEVTPTTFIFLC